MISDDDIELARSKPIEDVIGRWVDFDRRRSQPARGDYWALCPFHNERSPSFHVNASGGYFKCFGCGMKGDAIAFIMARQNQDFPGAVAEIIGKIEISETERAAAAARYRAERSARELQAQAHEEREIRKAKSLVARSRPIAGSIVETYLASRGIDFELVKPLDDLGVINGLEYWAPPVRKDDPPVLVGHWPAMVAAMRDIEGEILAAHLTYISKLGSGKAEVVHPETGEILPSKKMRGAARKCAIRLNPPAPTLGIAEGIENALHARMAEAIDGRALNVWAAGSLTALSGSWLDRGPPHPRFRNIRLPSRFPDPERPGLVLPDDVGEVLILADNDVADIETMRGLIRLGVEKFKKAGKRVGVAWPAPGLDFDDQNKVE